MSGPPQLDLSQPDEVLVPLLHKACCEVGFFYITNHGISKEVLDRALDESKVLFDLPLDVKDQ